MLKHRVETFIRHHHLFKTDDRLLVGVSGGVDSVVLLHVLHDLGYEMVVAHVNYGLRGRASEEDEEFVQRLSERLGVPCHTKQCDSSMRAEAHDQSIQAAARDQRYAVFARVAEAHAIHHVAVAHHLDDQAETVLLHLIRGSGPEGIAGMPVQRPLTPGSETMLVRPLLGIRREAISAYAAEHHYEWREDASNRDFKYQRNIVRGAVLPAIEKHFGEVATVNIARSAQLVRAYVDDSLKKELDMLFDRVALPETMSLDLEGLRGLATVWRRRVILEGLKRWLPNLTRSTVRSTVIENLVEAQPGRRVVFRDGSVWRGRDGLLFVPKDQTDGPVDDEVLIYPGEVVDLAQGIISTEEVAEGPEDFASESPETIIVDADRLAIPLALRRWQHGDRLQPLGMTGTKKVSDILTDARVPPHLRTRSLVLTSGDDIVWVVGLRMAHPYRIRPETQRFLKITYLSPTENHHH